MVKYEVSEQEDGCFVIRAKEDNAIWLVELVFEPHEKEYVEAFCRILNVEANRAYESAEWKMSKAYYDTTGRFFQSDIKMKG